MEIIAAIMEWTFNVPFELENRKIFQLTHEYIKSDGTIVFRFLL